MRLFLFLYLPLAPLALPAQWLRLGRQRLSRVGIAKWKTAVLSLSRISSHLVGRSSITE